MAKVETKYDENGNPYWEVEMCTAWGDLKKGEECHETDHLLFKPLHDLILLSEKDIESIMEHMGVLKEWKKLPDDIRQQYIDTFRVGRVFRLREIRVNGVYGYGYIASSCQKHIKINVFGHRFSWNPDRLEWKDEDFGSLGVAWGKTYEEMGYKVPPRLTGCCGEPSAPTPEATDYVATHGWVTLHKKYTTWKPIITEIKIKIEKDGVTPVFCDTWLDWCWVKVVVEPVGLSTLKGKILSKVDELKEGVDDVVKRLSTIMQVRGDNFKILKPGEESVTANATLKVKYVTGSGDRKIKILKKYNDKTEVMYEGLLKKGEEKQFNVSYTATSRGHYNIKFELYDYNEESGEYEFIKDCVWHIFVVQVLKLRAWLDWIIDHIPHKTLPHLRLTFKNPNEWGSNINMQAALYVDGKKVITTDILKPQDTGEFLIPFLALQQGVNIDWWKARHNISIRYRWCYGTPENEYGSITIKVFVDNHPVLEKFHVVTTRDGETMIDEDTIFGKSYNLEPGVYNVKVIYNGIEQSKTISIASKQNITITFNYTSETTKGYLKILATVGTTPLTEQFKVTIWKYNVKVFEDYINSGDRVELEEGHYKVYATYHGEEKVQDVDIVGGTEKTISFMFTPTTFTGTLVIHAYMGGEPLDNVHVTIMKGGHVIISEDISSGKQYQLQEGTYTINAVYNNRVQSKTATVERNKTTNVTFIFTSGGGGGVITMRKSKGR